MSHNKSFDPSTFDDCPELYDTALDWPYRKTLELPTLKNLLGDLSNLNVMDFGCGPGVITRWLHGQGANKVVGFDISEGMLDYALKIENRSPLGITYSSRIEESYLESFDIVLAVYVIPYLTDKQKLINMFTNVHQLLKPGGRFIALPIHPDFNGAESYYAPFGINLVEVETRHDASKVKLELRMPPHNIDIDAYYWTQETLNETLNTSGFQNIEWPTLEIPVDLPIKLEPYAKYPHAAIIQARK